MIKTFKKNNIQTQLKKDLLNKNSELNNIIFPIKEYKINNLLKKKEKSYSTGKAFDKNLLVPIYKPKNSRNINKQKNSYKKKSSNNINLRNSISSCININSLNQKDEIFNKNKKINYSIFINISNIEKKTDIMTTSDLSTIRKNLVYIPVQSKQKLSRSSSSSIIDYDKKTNLKLSNKNYTKNKQELIINKRNFSYIKRKYNLDSIILIQSFVRKFLIRNKAYKSLELYYKIEDSIKHMNKFIYLSIMKTGILKVFMERIKKFKKKRYFVNKGQYELIKDLKANNVHNFNEFKNFVIWCINNNVKGI